MKALIAVALAAVALTGCTDTTLANISAYGEEHLIICYSGGQVIFQDESTGKVEQLQESGLAFRSKHTGQLIRTYADCIVSVKTPP